MKQLAESISIVYKQKMKRRKKGTKKWRKAVQTIRPGNRNKWQFRVCNRAAGSHFVTYLQCFSFTKQTEGRES
jgi:hypothetical protein